MQDPAYPEPLSGREAVKKDAADFTAFPDIRFTVTKVLGEGDSIALEGRVTGTHAGPLPLPTGLIPATNKRVEVTMGIFLEVDGAGAIRQERHYYDIAGMLSQLGVMQ